MKIRIFALLIASLTTLAGVADAQGTAPTRDDSFETFDLTSIKGGIYYVMCQNYDERPDNLVECKRPTIWQEDNTVLGLQSSGYNVDGKFHEKDRPLLP